MSIQLARAGYVPTRVCVRLTGLALSTITKAIAARQLNAQRVGQKLWFVEWTDFLRWVGPLVAATLPTDPVDALRAGDTEWSSK